MAEQENKKPKASKAHKDSKYINKPIGVPELHVKKYSRGSLQFNTSKIRSTARRTKLDQTTENIKDAAINAAAAEILLPAEAGFIELDDANMKVFKLKQKEIIENVDANTAKNAFDLQLHDFAPYMVNYTRNGRHLLMGGRRGHIVTFDCHNLTMGTELQLQEEINDVQYLHNETLFAVAQKNFTYIYDNKGVEIHCLRRHERPIKLDYLPYHFLLSSINRSGWIKWHDISTGEYVAGFQTGFGPCRTLKQNPTNAVMHVGHTNGVVSLWSPNAGKALVSMLCHRSPITDLAIDREGKYMATTGLDGYLKLWDLRKFQHIHAYSLRKPANCVDISERGLISVACGRHIQIMKDAFTTPRDITYLNHEIRTPNAALSSGGGVTAATKALLSKVNISSIKFRPLEDVLCAGHSHGITSLIVPGSGEPNFDSFENNPFATLKQRREGEVQNLLNKLPSEMIVLDANQIGAIEKDSATLQKEQNELFSGANARTDEPKEKNRKRGRNKISAKLRRKQKNVIDEQVVLLKDKLAEQQAARKKAQNPEQAEERDALSRFK